MADIETTTDALEVNGKEKISNGGSASNEQNIEEVTEDVKMKILRQIEYYFGNYNLPRDKFLKPETEKDDGWINFETLLNFKRLASLSTNVQVILDSIKSSSLIEIHEGKGKIRRSKDCPLPEIEGDLYENTKARTIYCKGFPKDNSVKLDDLIEYFKEHGTIETVFMRRFHDKFTKKSGFKGSVLVVFPDKEKAKEFLEKEDVKYKNTPLLKMWQEDYLKEKSQEFEERRKLKEEKQLKREKDKEIIAASMPKGTYLHMSGFPSNCTREDVREALIQHTDDIAFIGYNKGDETSYVRLKTENSNKAVLEKIGEITIKDSAISIRIVEGEEEEEQLKKANEARQNSFGSRNNKRKYKGKGGPPNKKTRR